MMGHSTKCLDLATYWDNSKHRCVSCSIKPGYEVTPNCGIDDHGGRHERPFRECASGTFNDGSRADCRACSLCGPGSSPMRNCSTTADTECPPRPSVAVAHTTTHPNLTAELKVPTIPAGVWMISLAVVAVLSVILLAFGAVISKRRKRGDRGRMCCKGGSMYQNQDFSGSSSAGQSDLEEILNDVLSAPVQTVLDDLDVLEELVILLDPETQGKKNTKHLASHCSFPSTWITYTYSMRDSKSPLKAVLEGISSKHPDWTVGHLAKLLKQMDRNDAVAVLAKLKQYDQNFF
ncbi:IGF-like family receptor 1 [Oryzias latipes]|uniref:IGF-like family receptor 1 n=1 Tax=Oryzias latipes TaxID=8090 RepID=A0A3B3HDH6_ORYLA|nr:IGF-like family receptor 1 [Oryzias latipes]